MRLRPVWRIARWEAMGGAGGIDRYSLAIVAVGVLLLGLLLPVAATAGPAADADLYRVGVGSESPYHAPAQEATTIAVEAPDSRAFASGRLDVLVRGDELRVRDDPTGRAAAAALRSAVERFNDRRMRAEPDRAAAYPVQVKLRYVERDVGLLVQRPNGDAGGGAGGDGDGPDGVEGGQSEDPTPRTTPDEGGRAFGLGGLSLRGGSLFPQGAAGTPASISPPFPFASLVLAFALVIPMNFVVQAYASSVLHDRGNRRGEPLLVAPVSKWSVIAGKTLPYFALMLGIAALTAFVIGGGALSVLATVPIALLFLAGGFLAGLFARSHKELTFVLVTLSVAVTSFVFVPAIFADVHPVAAISPLSLVVRELEETAVGLGTIAFSVAPALLASVVLFGLGGGLYREEDLFAQVPLPAKALDALAAFVTTPRRAGWASVLSIPFVFLAELLVVALLFVVPVGLALPVLFASIALIEEVAKSLPAYAGFARGRYPRSGRTAVAVGGFSGLGFFLGEKAAAIAQVVGLFELEVARAAFELGAGVGGASSPALLAGLLLAPLVLHLITASITTYGASRDARSYGVGLVVAVAVHVGYNLGVVAALG